ncbi:hypothetical protein [Glycomyces sp. YM15]|uniref:hypothetical protein n=1 Tax=Glycomyces sp. YM15 TaxID=2800446 RepID=UPI001963259D|nr:hypothetical protein [Glycomyces sp. YM15]
MRRTIWTAVFLGLTAIVLGLEIWASADSNPDTVPWTDYITAHLPGEVTAAAIGALSAWLAVHFFRRYRRPNPPPDQE